VLALVIDTSSAAVTAGLVSYGPDGPVVLTEQITENARGHAELMAPAIRTCLRTAGITVAEIGAVVAGTGPGPFTGLRVGLVTAAAFADARDVPSYGVCSLDAIAVGLAGGVLVAGDARRKEIYWARYVDEVRVGEPAVDKPAALVESGALAGVAAMTGAGARLYVEVLGLPLLTQDYPSVLGLARCAADRVTAATPGEALVPLYLRRPDAVEPAPAKTVSQ
jgi:tRNA threonylcarbamoyl adenosine modification protein YeaZ